MTGTLTHMQTWMINGVQYDSLDAMPPDIRALVERGLPAVGQTTVQMTTSSTSQTFQSLDALPPELRAQFEQALARARGAGMDVNFDTAPMFGTSQQQYPPATLPHFAAEDAPQEQPRKRRWRRG